MTSSKRLRYSSSRSALSARPLACRFRSSNSGCSTSARSFRLSISMLGLCRRMFGLSNSTFPSACRLPPGRAADHVEGQTGQEQQREASSGSVGHERGRRRIPCQRSVPKKVDGARRWRRGRPSPTPDLPCCRSGPIRSPRRCSTSFPDRKSSQIAAPFG